MNKKVFIGGSRNIKVLTELVKVRLQNIINNNLPVLIGDCYGVDNLVNQFFCKNDYRNVTVYHIWKPRHNYGKFKTKFVRGNGYAEKDIEMACDCDVGFFIHDGKSKGTLNNIKWLKASKKPFLVYCTKNEKFLD